MSHVFRPRIATAVAIGLCGVAPAVAQETIPRVPQPGSTMPGSGTVDDPSMNLLGTNGGDLKPEVIKQMRVGLLEEARAVKEPAERALALARVGLSRTFTEQYDEAQQALAEAAQAVGQIKDRAFHDLRGTTVIRAQMELTQALSRQAFQENYLEPTDQPRSLQGEEPADRSKLLSMMEEVGRESSKLVGTLLNQTQRNETRLAIARALSDDAAVIFRGLPPQQTRPDIPEEEVKSLANVADRLNLLAVETAKAIEQPNWRDRALVFVTVNAASGKQYDRALEIARGIPAADIRYEALGRLADMMARADKKEEATAVFQECVQAIAAIPNEDPRHIAVGYVLQILVSLGRFDDARATAEMYGDSTLKRLGLGAVADSMGRRGLGKQARDWIDQIEDEPLKSFLIRRVTDGEIYAIRQSRAQAMFMDLPLDEGGEDHQTDPLR